MGRNELAPSGSAPYSGSSEDAVLRNKVLIFSFCFSYFRSDSKQSSEGSVVDNRSRASSSLWTPSRSRRSLKDVPVLAKRPTDEPSRHNVGGACAEGECAHHTRGSVETRTNEVRVDVARQLILGDVAPDKVAGLHPHFSQ